MVFAGSRKNVFRSGLSVAGALGRTAKAKIGEGGLYQLWDNAHISTPGAGSLNIFDIIRFFPKM
jgi:hypothetical protein